MRPYVLPAAVLALFTSLLLAEASWYRSTKSVTFDETFYLSCGLQTVHDGWIDPRIAGEGVGPLPVLINFVPALLNTGGRDRVDPWVGEPADRDLIRLPRLVNSIAAGAALVVVVFVWLYRRRGLAAAGFGAGMIALSPSIVAHASLATTDLSFAVFAILALAALAWYLRSTTWPRFLTLVVATGAALTAKYSAVFLLPTIGIMFFLHALKNRGGAWRTDFLPAVWSSVRTFALFLCLFVPVWWGFHLFSYTGPLKNVPIEETPDWSPWVKMLGRGPLATEFMDVAHRRLKRPAPIAGVLFQFLHNSAGHPAYLMGERSQGGWWYYFPCAFVFKSTPAELALTAGLLAGLAFSWRRIGRLDVELQVLLLGGAIFVVMLLTSRIAIGHRYLVVLSPLVVLVATELLFAWRRRRIASAAAVLLLASQAVSNAAIAPDFLAYFNFLSGGPEGGRSLLVDSNLDWGQDLPALRDVLAERNDAAVAISYFGTADLESYGIAADPVAKLPGDAGDYTAFAISVTHLQGVYVAGDDPLRAFRGFKPAARAGYSILVYDLDTPEKRTAFRTAADAVHKATLEREEQERQRKASLTVN